MNDRIGEPARLSRLPYADVSIAAVLVAVGTALAAYPWLGGTATLSLAIASGGLVLAMSDLISRSGRRRQQPRGRVIGAHGRERDFVSGSV